MRADVVSLFDRPARWRADAATSLGLRGPALAAALSPGPAYPAVLRTIRAAFPDDVQLIVDVGAGLGGASAWLAASTDAAVVAVEPAAGSRAAARRSFPNLTVIDGAVDHVPLPDGCADVVTALNVTSLVDDLGPLLGEADRLLRPGGVLGIADLFAPGDDIVAAGPNTFRTQPALLQDLAAAGFTATEIAIGPPVPHPRWQRVATAVDVQMSALHAGARDRAELRRWRQDQRHLRRAVHDHALVGGCVVARAATDPR